LVNGATTVILKEYLHTPILVVFGEIIETQGQFYTALQRFALWQRVSEYVQKYKLESLKVVVLLENQ
jgi:acyl-coenzyme A synthetase/AMP-(fatty) acid ligase